MPRVRIRLTVGLLMKLVAYIAVALGCIMPVVEFNRAYPAPAMSGRAGAILLVVFEGILIPLAWVALSAFVMRPESGRDRLIYALLLCPVSICLVGSVWIFATFIIPSYRNPAAFGGTRPGPSVPVMFGVLFVALCATAVYLMRKIIRSSKILKASVDEQTSA